MLHPVECAERIESLPAIEGRVVGRRAAACVDQRVGRNSHGITVPPPENSTGGRRGGTAAADRKHEYGVAASGVLSLSGRYVKSIT
jgi:hypothetical protein